jgi:hypothetical protein
MILFKKVLILLLTAGIMLAAYLISDFWKLKINPGKSFFRYALFVMMNLITIFALIFLLSLLLFAYKEFFFKK